MKQPELEELRSAVCYATDPLEIVNAFYRFYPDQIERHGFEKVAEHRLCCLAEMIVDLSERFNADLAIRDREIERLRADLSHYRVQLLSAARACEMFVQEFDCSYGIFIVPSIELIELARFHATQQAAREAAGAAAESELRELEETDKAGGNDE